MMDLAADLPLLFTDFASAGTLAGRPVEGIYREHQATPDVGGMLTQRAAPDYLLPAGVATQADVGASLVIPQGTFTVRRVEPEDDGLVRVLLKEPAP